MVNSMKLPRREKKKERGNREATINKLKEEFNSGKYDELIKIL